MKKYLPWLISAAVVVLLGLGFWRFAFDHSPKAQVKEPLALTAQDRIEGNENAPVTLIEYGDFQCPVCGNYYPLVNQLQKEFPDNLKIVFRNFPLYQIHEHALEAARAAEAAGKQGKFWEMYDLLYVHQKEWSSLKDVDDQFKNYAQELGLSMQDFIEDYKQSNPNNKSVGDKINQDLATGHELGVQGTPTFFVNGEKIANPQSYEDFKTFISAALLKNPAPQSSTAKYHAHVNFKVYINGKALDFSQAKYQSEEGKELNENVHLHDGNGDVIHLHKVGITLADFFKSLKMEYTGNCLKLDTGEQYCTQGNTTLDLVVNGKGEATGAQYVMKDLDRILLRYGNNNQQAQISQEMASVADNACIYSEKCPERGKPPTESCVGGLGTDCESDETNTPSGQ